MAIIQQPATGYLHALGLFTTGANPREVSEFVQPVMPMTPFYMARHLVGATNATASQLIGDQTDVAPAPNRGWWLCSVQGGLGPVAAGEQCRVALMIVTNNNNSIRIGVSDMMTAVAANAQLTLGVTLPQPILLPSGFRVRAEIQDVNVAAARLLNCAVLAYEFDL